MLPNASNCSYTAVKNQTINIGYLHGDSLVIMKQCTIQESK